MLPRGFAPLWAYTARRVRQVTQFYEYEVGMLRRKLTGMFAPPFCRLFVPLSLRVGPGVSEAAAQLFSRRRRLLPDSASIGGDRNAEQ